MYCARKLYKQHDSTRLSRPVLLSIIRMTARCLCGFLYLFFADSVFFFSNERASTAKLFCPFHFICFFLLLTLVHSIENNWALILFGLFLGGVFGLVEIWVRKVQKKEKKLPENTSQLDIDLAATFSANRNPSPSFCHTTNPF